MIDRGAMDTPGVYITDGKFRVSSAYTGTRIEITPDEIATYQESSKINEIDSDGISVLVSTSYYDERSYQFRRADGTVVARTGGYYNTTGYVNAVEMIAKSVASYDSTARVRSESPTGEVAQAIMSAYHGAAKYADLVCNITTSEQSSIMAVIDGTIRLNVDPTGVDVAGTLAVTGGITATTTVKATGDIWADEFSTAAGSNRWRLGAGLAGQPPSITHKVVIEIDGAEWWLAAYPNH